jgi:hypothetical protein
MSIPRACVDDEGLCAVQKFSKAPRELSIYLRLEAIWVIYDATKHGSRQYECLVAATVVTPEEQQV